MDKRFNFKEAEREIYRQWEKSGYFNPDQNEAAGIADRKKGIFSMVLPPPNVTGVLHIGHALMLVIEDILTRYNRMKGRLTLWLPGTDHAAIATQAKVEASLYKKEGKTRYDLGREKFLALVDKFARESHDTIVQQIRRMGASVDWSREAFTLDEPRSLAVRTAFKKLFDLGLIYRGHRIVNWDPKMRTTVSDDEIEWIEEKAPLYYFRYGPFIISTARPETKFGDKYVVMHPDDKRYLDYKPGQKIDLEWINGPITATVIKDEAVDPEFGTGVMTITPWHDATDFEIAERHNLDREQIIDFNGRLLPIAGEFSGLKIKEARPKIVEKLKNKGLLVKVDENYIHRVAVNSRGGGVIEPQIKEQWFISVNKPFVLENSKIDGIKPGQKTTLKNIMSTAVKSGQIKILPDRFEKNYFHWIDNLRDWCISRQIWYGHRIPAYYCQNRTEPACREPVVSIEPVENCSHCQGKMEQDPDTLDTWFSSGLWTFSTLGWPNQTEDLATFHPTSVLETGYDILFFWIARMILMSGALLGEVPFKTVYLHGIIRDEQGRKMSKSLGNVIEPVSVIENYGADAIRLALIIGNGPGNDINLSEEKIKSYRNFTTKIWNAARFLALNLPDDYQPPAFADLPADLRAKVEAAAAAKKEVGEKIEGFHFHLAADKAYHYFWDEFANNILEELKPALRSDSQEEKAAAYRCLELIMSECLKMLHPFMPFVTEAVYQNLKLGSRELLMVESW